jgi:anaerobic magnesium-protoporphyrin IX monomethyl ester cyclase
MIFTNIRRLKAETRIDLHLDLVAGLPGEDYTGFLNSLQTVADLEPDMLQVEPLKVLKGAPMRAIANREEYAYSDAPPYTILRNPWLTYNEICRIETIGRLLDLFYNHGGFKTALELLTCNITISQLMDRMTHTTGNQNLFGLSSQRLYELFFNLAAPHYENDTSEFLSDALFFDYCRREMPRQGKLPKFIEERQKSASWPSAHSLTTDLNLPVDSRVKAFRFIFRKDYRNKSSQESSAEITFVYASHRGSGLKITTI